MNTKVACSQQHITVLILLFTVTALVITMSLAIGIEKQFATVYGGSYYTHYEPNGTGL